ncbi:MAG: hypothetical protein KAH95_17070, partial [Spirochaetales bacterium]|nr:hypothetical protein [Spirochaetales bacterium]
MLLPDSKFRQLWDPLVLLVAIYSAITIPLIIIFDIFSDQFCTISAWGTTAVFLGDIIVNFNTARSVKGKLVLNRKEIALRYIKTWFIIDLISAIP